MGWAEGKDFEISSEEKVMLSEEPPLYSKLPENEKQYAFFTDGSCCISPETEIRRGLIQQCNSNAANINNNKNNSNNNEQSKISTNTAVRTEPIPQYTR